MIQFIFHHYTGNTDITSGVHSTEVKFTTEEFSTTEADSSSTAVTSDTVSSEFTFDFSTHNHLTTEVDVSQGLSSEPTSEVTAEVTSIQGSTSSDITPVPSSPSTEDIKETTQTSKGALYTA